MKKNTVKLLYGFYGVVAFASFAGALLSVLHLRFSIAPISTVSLVSIYATIIVFVVAMILSVSFFVCRGICDKKVWQFSQSIITTFSVLVLAARVFLWFGVF